MKPSKNHSKKPNVLEFVGTRRHAVFGFGIVPYCKIGNCWMLPAGPKQLKREVKSYSEAMRYAEHINTMIVGAPALAIRLRKAA